MSLRGRFRRIERGFRGDLATFLLQDGSRYFFNPRQVDSDLFLFSYDVLLGRQADPPPILRKVCEAKDPRVALEKLQIDPGSGSLAGAHGSLHEIVDLDALVRHRRIVVFEHEPAEDFSE